MLKGIGSSTYELATLALCSAPNYFCDIQNPGRLKLQSANIVFKNLKTGKVDTFVASDVDKTHWLVRARGHCFKVILKSGTTHRFDGFKETVSFYIYFIS